MVTTESTTRPTTATVNLDDLAYNLNSARSFIGDEIRIMAVVKADAYGHGSVECARRLENAGVDWLGVVLPEEGVELRDAGVTIPILSLGSFWPGQEEMLLSNGITPVVYQIDRARRLNSAAASLGVTANIHVKIDTGMGRLGVRHDEAAKFVTELATFGNLRVEGMMTHFASADEPAEDGFTHRQVKLFYETVELFRLSGHDPSFIDLANSPGAVVHPESRGNMVRLGGILYGLGRDVLPDGVPKPDLRPVMSLTSAIANLKHVPKGETIGYGRTFTTERDSVIAAVPIGYHDGFRRGLSNKARVIIRGRFAPVVGRVSMDWTMVDVTDITDAAADDEVILIGEQNGCRIGAEDLAADLGTISYEITCGINRRVVRKYLSSISSTNEAA